MKEERKIKIQVPDLIFIVGAALAARPCHQIPRCTLNTRACVAYIAAGMCGLSKTTALYDHGQARAVSATGPVSAGKIDVYDFDRSCHVSGSLENLYDHGNGAHIHFACDGEKFSGYDYASKFHFNGTVEAGFVSLYDYETSVYYRYS